MASLGRRLAGDEFEACLVGGGFGAGIHNTPEAAAFGLPVIFGPNYKKFKEARDLISLNLGFSIAGADELENVFTQLTQDENALDAVGQKIKEYVRDNTGATEMIMGYINSLK